MILRVIAVSARQAIWVRNGTDEYCRRLPPDWRVEWRDVKPEPRGGASNATRWRAVEGTRIRAQLPTNPYLVALDETGDDLDTATFAQRLERWRDTGRPIVMLIGGPDGLDEELLKDANERVRLSSLTLPHGLVRVVLAEQIYRAWSVLAQHPYHRDG